jgi:hypothetical protein
MRTSILTIVVLAGSAVAFPAAAQQQPGTQQAAPSELTSEQIQMQREADKGIKTRNSGESGYVGSQDKSGASDHPPGRPESDQTTGSTGQSGGAKAYDKPR